MEELLAWIARGLVDEPDAVRVERVEEADAVVLRLSVAPDDVGKVIGRQGRVARALRHARPLGRRKGRQAPDARDPELSAPSSNALDVPGAR